MPLPSTYKQYIFDERPTENITSTTFKRETKSTGDLKVGPGQVLVKVTWISLDPAMRSWLNDSKRAYTPPVKLGEVMRAAGLGVVVGVGEGSKFSVGDEVSGVVGEYYDQITFYTQANGVYLQAGGSTLSSTTSSSPGSRSCTLLLCKLWQIYSYDLHRTIPGAQALDFLGPLGHVGMTAYFVSQPHPH